MSTDSLPEIVAELMPHVGVKQTEFGDVPVKFKQSYVLVNGRQCGYIADDPGAPIVFIAINLPDNVLDEIKRQVDEIRGVESRPYVSASHIISPEDEAELENMKKGTSSQDDEEDYGGVPDSSSYQEEDF